MKKLGIGVIGLGYWGPNFVRVATEVESVDVVWCCDKYLLALDKFRRKFPNIKAVSDYKKALAEVDAVIVVTPAKTHREVVSYCLAHGKHVLVEKPLATNCQDALELAKLAKEFKRVLMVDHIFLFNPSVVEFKKRIDDGELGDLWYLNAFYTALGPIRRDTNVLFDLGPHWIYTISHLVGASPISVSAHGEKYLSSDLEDVVFLSLRFPGKVLANLALSWVAPRKVRTIEVIGSKKMALFDDASPDQKLTIYDKGVHLEPSSEAFIDYQAIYRDGEIRIPKIEKAEPLKSGFLQFLEAIRNKQEPMVNGEAGFETVKVLEAAQKSLNSGGSVVKL